MPRSSFTARLMLAMMLTVVIVTSGVLWLMRQRVETSYLRLFEERFRSQIDMFTGMQKVRLESLRQRCRMLAASAAVVEALQLGTGELPDGIRQDLQAKARAVGESAAAFDGRTRRSSGSSLTDGSGAGSIPVPIPISIPVSSSTLNSGGTGTGGTAAAPITRSAEPRRRQLRTETADSVDLALISSLGRVYSLKSGAAEDNRLRWLEDDGISRVPAEQQTGYVMAETNHQFRMPREVILTPVHDPQSGEILGALAVGLPMTGYGENSLYDLNRPGKPGSISTGLWLEDHLFTSSIAAADQEALKARVRQATQAYEADPSGGTGTISVRVNLSGQDHQMLLRQLSTDSALPMAWGVMLSSLAGMTAEQHTLRNGVLASAGLALGVGLLLSFFLSRNLMRPVRELVRGTHEIREGHYATRVRIGRRDEIGLLGESFNDMAGGLEQRERYHGILVQLSDYNVARRLIASPSLGGERRDVSVLFCDIRGFTAISGAMDPEGVIGMLNEHMTALTECVHRHHGVVDKFVGDLIMAVFGAPETTADPAGDAARCALDMTETRRRLNLITDHPVLEIGTGIASGVCLAGCMGSQNRLNYTVLGEPVNLASRLCSAAAPGEILIAPLTAEGLGETFLLEPREEKTFKGFSRPIRPCALRSLRDDPTPVPPGR
ncbi:MAG: adenylate/guanylate cyclase domain-containing protein [Verrucomicrobiota bacterium]